VSANPTGPLHVGNGRGGVLGSALAAVLKAAGYQVHQEYYINDTGAQMGVFQRSIWARYQQALGNDVPFPDDGYGGAYLVDLARDIAVHEGDRFAKDPQPENQQALAELGMKTLLANIRTDLEALGVTYDQWYSERSLYADGTYDKAMDLLRKGGHVAEREGAQWFTSTAVGEDKDNVLIRTTGVPTYFASDAAYHYNKFMVRKFDRVINIWGADHQGHVSRVKAITAALGADAGKLDVLLTQLVTLRRGAEVVRLSKRAGEIIALQDVLEEVGRDACRFFFLARSADSQMDFDLELAKKQSSENPVYYVQYAHARTAGVLRTGEERGMDWRQGDVSLLTEAAELALVRTMLRLPEVIETAALNLEPHHLAYFAQDLATALHDFYEKHRVITDDAALSQARLKLVAATGLVLARTLGLMGLSAPERM
jgi:arginyl-tRNA synthetase